MYSLLILQSIFKGLLKQTFLIMYYIISFIEWWGDVDSVYHSVVIALLAQDPLLTMFKSFDVSGLTGSHSTLVTTAICHACLSNLCHRPQNTCLVSKEPTNYIICDSKMKSNRNDVNVRFIWRWPPAPTLLDFIGRIYKTAIWVHAPIRNMWDW